MTDKNQTAQKKANIVHGTKLMSGSLTTDILQDPNCIAEDISMVSRMVKSRRWPEINPKRQRHIISRLFRIVRKDLVTTDTPSGPVIDEAKADSNSIAAAKVLLAIEGQVQADQHHQDNLKKQTEPTQINIDNRRVIVLPQNGRESKALEQH